MKHRFSIIVCVAVCAVMTAAAGFLFSGYGKQAVFAEAIPSYESADQGQGADEDRITAGITIGGMDVSGLTYTEARNALEETVAERKTAPVTLIGPEENEQIKLTAGELGYTVDFSEALDKAMSFGHAQNIIQRYKEQKDLEREGRNYDFSVSIDRNILTAAVNSRCREFDQPAKEPLLRRENGSFIVEVGQKGYILDSAVTADAIAEVLENGFYGQPVSVNMTFVVDEPRGRTEDLSGIKDLLGTFTTSYTSSGSARCGNIENGCRLLNGKILYPGEELSVLQNITPFTEENGYFLAGSYLGNKVVDSLGGGICQVSTTLYNAVIRAELKVTARSNHSLIVGYVQPSMDAAIAESANMDFRFVNSTDHPIYVEGYTSNKSITFNIYGTETRARSRKVSFESETLETIPPEGLDVVEDPTQPVGYVSLETGHTGYKAQLWKIVSENDLQLSRDVFNRSNYNMTPDTVTVGTGGTVTAGLRAAMESKDLAAIRAAAQVAASMQSGGPLAEQASYAAQAAYEAALADGADTETAMNKAQDAANAVVAAANGESSGSQDQGSSDSNEAGQGTDNEDYTDNSTDSTGSTDEGNGDDGYDDGESDGTVN